MNYFKYFFLFLAILNFQNSFAQEDKFKYPDRVVEAHYSGYFEVFDSLYGGRGIDFPILMDVNKILGENKQKWFVSLPLESYLILEYTDNEIIDAENQDDIVVIEHGCCQEFAQIFVSNDGENFEFLGEVDDCENNELDLATIGFDLPVKFIKIVGLDVKCASPGFDMVSIYGLPGANVDLYVGMERVDEFFEKEEFADKILILENVYFETDEAIIKSNGVADLDKVLTKLQQHAEFQVHISGHTDAVASEIYNLKLSNQRANAVKRYLIDKGIDKNRIQTHGFGEMKPLRTNDTEEGRAYNRRVEIRKLN